MIPGSAAFWALLLIVGQIASLTLITAGNRVGYQHYRLDGSLSTWVAGAVLVVQAAWVIGAARLSWPDWRRWCGQHLSFQRLAGLGAFVVLVSATASADPVFFAGELVLAGAIQLVAIGNALLLARAFRRGAVPAWMQPREGVTGSGWRDPVALSCAAFVFVAATALAVGVYQLHPHVPDEVVYLFHAQYLAKGQLAVPMPPVQAAFNVDITHYDGTRWYVPTPPGWPMLLAVGVRLGVPWLVNPLLGALNVLLAHAVLVQMHDRRTARLATLLLATSPWFLFMSMNLMTHQATLCMALLAALAVARVRRRRQVNVRSSAADIAGVFAGGLAIGMASLVRPLEGLAIALLLGFWSLPSRWWTARMRWRTLVPSVALASGAIVSGALVRPYNAALTGDASRFPIMAYVDTYYGPGSNDLGFGANRGLGWPGLDPFPGHGAADVVVNTNLNVTATNVELFGWPTGSLVVLLLPFVLRGWRREDLWHVAVIATIIGLHALYWFSGGPDFGARYWYLIIVSCCALGARGILRLDTVTADPSGRSGVLQTALVLVASTQLTFVPWRATDKYYHYRNMRPDIRELAREHGFERSLVLVRGNRHPDYASAFTYNPLDLRADTTIYAWDASADARAQVLTAYRDRQVWFVDGPTITGNGFRVAAGPMSAADAAAWSPP